MSSSKKITLKSSDGETFEVEESVAMESQTIKHLIELCADGVIPVPEVRGAVLAKVIEYCKKHVEFVVENAEKDSKSADENLTAWDAEFIRGDQSTFFELFMAANYLNIFSLIHLAALTLAYMIKGKTPKQIRRTFKIKNDLNPEEEEEEEEDEEEEPIEPYWFWESRSYFEPMEPEPLEELIPHYFL